MGKIQKAVSLYQFAVSGDINYISDFAEEYMEDFKQLLFRGLHLPTAEIFPGSVIYEWNGCTHWSSDANIAKRFTVTCEAEEYVEEYGLNHGTDGSFEQGLSLFSKVILRLDSASSVIPIGKHLSTALMELEDNFNKALQNSGFSSNDLPEDIIAEDEHTLIGYNFLVKKVTKEDDIYILNVIQLKNTKEKENIIYE